MLTKRHDADHYTEIAIWNEGDEPAYQSYRVLCMDLDIGSGDTRKPPTARISTPGTPPGIGFVDMCRLAAEYVYVADIAEALQAEKRAAYAARFGA